jgi:hypothetical protein
LPLSDTLKIEVNIEPPVNTDPYFVKPVNPITTVTLSEGGFYESDFEVRDDENDELILSITNNGFILADAGITVQIDEPRVNGIIKGKIRWDAFCDIYDFTKRTSFEVKININDKDVCDLGKQISTTFRFSVNLPGNSDPFIDTDLTSDPQERKVLNLQRRINESLSFLVTGKDLVDNDLLILDLKQRDSLEFYGISFPVVAGNGIVASRFNWDLTCGNVDLKKKSNFTFQFIVIDNANKCRFYKADTVDVQVKILPPLNAQPQLTVQQGTKVVNEQTVDFTLGQSIQFLLTGVDADVLPEQDLISLSLIEATGNVKPEGYSFVPVQGQGRVETTFSWTPDCSIFENGLYENNYLFKFRLADNRCYAIKADTVSVQVTIQDVVSSESEFIPPNVFTPNGDGCNDYFALEGISSCSFNSDPMQNPDQQISLPLDNCVNRFESVRIYNRWGTQVFESAERKFRWYATDQAAGVYYYVVKYTSKEYKGSLSIRF